MFTTNKPSNPPSKPHFDYNDNLLSNFHAQNLRNNVNTANKRAATANTTCLTTSSSRLNLKPRNLSAESQARIHSTKAYSDDENESPESPEPVEQYSSSNNRTHGSSKLTPKFAHHKSKTQRDMSDKPKMTRGKSLESHEKYYIDDLLQKQQLQQQQQQQQQNLHHQQSGLGNANRSVNIFRC